MTILWCLMKSLQRRVEAHLHCSNGTLCYHLRRLEEYKTLFILAQLKTVMLVREAITMAFL